MTSSPNRATSPLQVAGTSLGYIEADLDRLLEVSGGGPLASPEDVRRIIDGYQYLDDWRADYRIQSVRSSLHSSRITCMGASSSSPCSMRTSSVR